MAPVTSLADLRGIVVLVVFAAAAWTAARRWASPMAAALVCGVFPVVALGAMQGSLGWADATPFEWVTWTSLGLVPASVCAAIAVVEIAWVIGGRRAGRRPSW